MVDKPEKEQHSAKRASDHFWLNQVYPDAAESFLHSQRPISEIKADCLVVLDANVLLMPYRLGAQSLDELNKVYSGLSQEKRLAIPAQAAREFLKNRGNRIRDVAREINNQASLIQVPMDKRVGFLENEESFKELQNIAEEIKKLKADVLSKTRDITLKLRSDVGSDPVSVAYRKIFTESIVDLNLDEKARKELVDEMRWRYAHDIPPGYRDDDKLDEGIGDLLIWKTILKTGSERALDCIFVTEDAKGDWWVKSEGTFQPRIELIEEYRRATKGKTIHLVPLSELLLIFGAKSDAVDDTKRVEEARPAVQRSSARPPTPPSPGNLPLALGDGWEDMDVQSLVELNSSLLDLRRQRSVEHHRIKNRLSRPDLMSDLPAEEVAGLYREQDRLWEEFRVINRRQKEVEQRVRELLLGE